MDPQDASANEKSWKDLKIPNPDCSLGSTSSCGQQGGEEADTSYLIAKIIIVLMIRIMIIVIADDESVDDQDNDNRDC